MVSTMRCSSERSCCSSSCRWTAPSSTCSRTVVEVPTASTTSWGSLPTRRSLGRVTTPSSGSRSPIRVCSRVVLPAPLPPTSAVQLPGGKRSVTPENSCRAPRVTPTSEQLSTVDLGRSADARSARAGSAAGRLEHQDVARTGVGTTASGQATCVDRVASAGMHLLSLDAVGASVEGRTLFADASFGLTSEDRVGVVGPNGVGKTTLLRILVGERAPDAGSVIPRSGLRIGWLPQEMDLPDATAADIVAQGDPLARDDEVAVLLDRLGVAPELPVARASGGQRRRVALARTLLAPTDLLVLDEPTNHLDVDAVDWLEEELARRRSGLVLITHDRYVLERSVNHMLDLDPPAPGQPAEVWWHDGAYSSLLEARAERAATRERTTARARNLYS